MDDSRRLEIICWAFDSCKGQLSDKIILIFFAKECDDDLVVRGLSADAIGIINNTCMDTSFNATRRLEDSGLIKRHRTCGLVNSYALCIDRQD